MSIVYEWRNDQNGRFTTRGVNDKRSMSPQCLCGHHSDLHSLIDLAVHKTRKDSIIRWRFDCKGFVGATKFAKGVKCECRNFRSITPKAERTPNN